MIYLASPYSHPDELVQEARYKAARNYVHWSLLYLEDTVYSPIVHYHTLAELSGLPPGFDFWRKHNFRMLALASQVDVLTIEGWNRSVGVAAEMVEASRLGIPIHEVEPV
jgi:predicted acyl esterase